MLSRWTLARLDDAFKGFRAAPAIVQAGAGQSNQQQGAVGVVTSTVRRRRGGGPDGEAAIDACKRIVGCLAEAFEPGMTGDELYGNYTSFGDDPFVMPTSGEPCVEFSAWSYARTQCTEVAAAG